MESVTAICYYVPLRGSFLESMRGIRKRHLPIVGFASQAIPVVHEKILPMDRLYVVPAAVSGTQGIATMGVYNLNGLSSSLSAPAAGLSAKWASSRMPTNATTVTTFAMADVLNAYRGRVWYLKTDMQGHDFVSLKSAGQLLRTVP